MTQPTPLSAKMAKVPAWAGLLAALLLAVFWAWNPINVAAEKQAQRLALGAAGVYVSLRTLNAVLSTAQEVEVQAAFVVGGSAQPLKTLEPIDDTVERIADVVFWIMLAAAAMAVAAGPVAAIGAGLTAVAIAVHMWRPTSATYRLMIYGAALGVALPLILVVAEPLGRVLTHGTYAENTARIEAVTDALPSPDQAFEAPMDRETGEDGFFSGLSRGIASVKDGASDAVGAVDRYRKIATQIFANADILLQAYLSLLAVLIFRVVMVPVILAGLVWLVLRALRA